MTGRAIKESRLVSQQIHRIVFPSNNHSLHIARGRFAQPSKQDHVRSLRTAGRFAYPRTDSQDRNSINTEATEYSKTGSDDLSAQQDEAAYNPNITNPQKQKDVAGDKSGVSFAKCSRIGPHNRSLVFSLVHADLSP